MPGISSGPVFRFGLFEANVERNTLTRDGVRVKVQDQPFRVLVSLLERPGETVTREELRRKLWPEGTYVDFDGSLNVILKKLRAAIDDNSENPVFIETIPRKGYRFIAPVSVSPSNHTQNLAAAGVNLVPPQPSPSIASVAPQASIPHGVYLAMLLLLAVAVIATSIAWRNRPKIVQKPSVGPPVTASPRLRKSVAILGFQNVFGRPEDAWIGTALSEMLSTELAAGENLRLVSGEDVSDLRLSSPWPESDSLSPATAARLGTSLNSDFLVLGSYTTLGDRAPRQLRIDVRLQDRKGEILAEIAQTGDAKDLFRLVTRAGAILRDRLEVPRVEDADQAAVLASLPLDPEAARLYALGINKLREFDAAAAKDVLEQAIKADPKFSLAHAMLARAWMQLGYEQKRREEAKKALDLATDLPRAERMLVEGDYYESLGNHDQAASTYHVLFELFPDSIDYGLALAAAQLAGGHASESRATLQQIRKQLPSAAQDPRIDLLEAKASPNKPDSLVLIRVAIQKASSQGKKLIYAQARHDECLTLLYGEQPEKAPAACKDAYNIFMSAGNRLGAADSLRLLADHEGYSGHLNQAIPLYMDALAVLNGLGEHEKTGAILNNMAIVYENQGDLNRAEQLYSQAKMHFAQAGDLANEAGAIGNIADILYLRGDLANATKLYEQSLRIQSGLDPSRPGYVLYRLADLQLTAGRVQNARRLAEQAIAVMRPEHGGLQYLTGAMLVLGEVLESAGDLKGAREQFEEALSIRKRVGALDLVAETQAELANLALERGHPGQAEILIRTAVPQYENENDVAGESDAYTILSRALLMQSKYEQAESAANRAVELSRSSPDLDTRVPALIQMARVQAENRAQTQASLSGIRQVLLSAVASSRKFGYYRLECEARLALGELELKSSRPLGLTQLSRLSTEARSHGLELISRHADQDMAAADLPATTNSVP